MVALYVDRQQMEELRSRSLARQVELEQRFAHTESSSEAIELATATEDAGREELLGLIEAVGLHPPVPAAEIPGLLRLAAQVCLGAGLEKVSVTATPDGTMHLQVEDCPIYRRLEALGAGNTACTCFARRRGWYRAMGVALRDQLETTQKWGDPFCSATIFAA